MEALNQNFGTDMTTELGVNFDQVPIWTKGITYEKPEMLVKISLQSHTFLNEANLVISTSVLKFQEWMKFARVVINPINIGFVIDNEFEYSPTTPPEKGLFIEIEDSPKICHLKKLQRVNNPAAKFRLHMFYHEELHQCDGIIQLNIPICKNMPLLKIANF